MNTTDNLIYFIIQIRDLDSAIGVRCVGYHKNLDKALECVEKDYGGLNEAGYYPYVVVEGAGEGVYNYEDRPMYYFQYNYKEKKFQRIPTPEFTLKFVSWCIG